MDKIPELYIGVLGILKIGAIAQPLFSAFGDESLFVRLENAQTKAVITQRKHAPKVRKILDKLPYLEHLIIVDHDGKTRCKDREVAFSPGKGRARRKDSTSTRPRPNRRPSSITPRARPDSPRASSTSTTRSSAQYLTAKWVLDVRTTTSTGARPTPAGSPARRTASSAPGAWA